MVDFPSCKLLVPSGVTLNLQFCSWCDSFACVAKNFVSHFLLFFPDSCHLAMWVVDLLWVKPYYISCLLFTSKFGKGNK